MNQQRILRGLARHFEPIAKRRRIHTPSLPQRIPRVSSIRKELLSPLRWTPYAWPKPSRRLQSTLTAGSKERTAQETAEAEDRWANTPAYEMTFTCKQCNTRSSHKISKQGYHHGTVLIACPGCKNRHLIADHMKIFSDKSVTLEDIMKEKGQLVKRGTLNTEGDVEFWDDGTEVKRDA